MASSYTGASDPVRDAHHSLSKGIDIESLFFSLLICASLYPDFDHGKSDHGLKTMVERRERMIRARMGETEKDE